MAAKQVTMEAQARKALLLGVEKLTRAVRSTLGPRGRNAILSKSWGAPTVTKDGVTVAEEIELADKNENLGVQMVKEAASKTSDAAGDGTTTATVLAEAIFKEGYRNLAAGADPMSLARGIRTGVDAVVEEVKRIAIPIKGDEDIRNVAAVSANNDPEVGKMLAEAMAKVGRDGVITVEEGKGIETAVEVVEGMQFDRGFLSPHFVTDPESMECELEKPLILLHEDKISSVTKLIPLLEKVSQAKRPLLIIAEDIEGEALATLVVNKLRGILSVCAVKAPGYGDRRKAMMEDVAILTDARAIFEDLGMDLESVELSDLGRAKKVTVSNSHTTIVEGAGTQADIRGRVAQIEREIEETTSDYDREKLQERLAKLSGGVAQINVGAATETEMKEKKARVEDALNATHAAVEEGILPGGGVALFRAASALGKLKLEGDEAIGADVVQSVLAVPLMTIADNAGLEGAVVARRIERGDGYAFGYDAENEQYCDLVKAGVIDPMKVIRVALQNAVSVAGIVLSTECLIREAKEEKEEGPPGGPHGMHGGMGGMGDMDMM